MTWVHSRRFPILLAAATLIPVGALAWLGVRTLQQDRELERQRQREGLEVAAARVALEIERQLQDIEQDLSADRGIRFRPDRIDGTSAAPILFQPVDTASPGPSPSSLAAAEIDEFQRRDLTGAAAAYRRLSGSSADVRAAALVGLGRVLRAQADFGGATRAYDDLAALGAQVVAGQPAELVARQGRIRVFQSSGDESTLRAEVDSLARALSAGRWTIDRSTFELYRDLIVELGAPPPAASDVARSEAAVSLWRDWRRGELEPRGRRLISQGPTAVLALWSAETTQATAHLLTRSDMLEAWRPLWTAQHLEMALRTLDGQAIAGERADRGISLGPGDTRLPFILSASPAPSDNGPPDPRRQLLISGLVLVVLVMVAASYGLYRTTTREIALARQQTDFVSSVSHEFRTPLTSMRHLTELLASNSITSEERKRHYYDLLAHETERLHRMVDSLLSFGRMSAGAYAWQLEASEVNDVVAKIVEEFRRDPIADRREVTCDLEDRLPPIRADREALSRALWNLLENAGKYSEPGTPIRVFARRQADSVLLGVQDAGAGIPPSEQARIFQKFVRGHDATRAGVRGVGIGLALVSRIVEAHGGTVRLESEPGRGSTFTLVLPCLES